jgi:hypothetical protein
MKNYKIVIDGDKINILDSMLNQVPYGFAKPLVDFINSCVVEDKPEEKPVVDPESKNK